METNSLNVLGNSNSRTRKFNSIHQKNIVNPETKSDKHLVVLCTAGYDHTIRFWEALSGICYRTIQHPDSQVNRLCISKDKKVVAAAGHLSTCLYDVQSLKPEPIIKFEGHSNNITGLAFSNDNQWLATGSEDGTLKIWDLRSPVVQRNYDHKSGVNDLIVHPKYNNVISCDSGGSVKVWDLGENLCTHELVAKDGPLRSVSVSGDGKLLVAAATDGSCYSWTLDSKLASLPKAQAHFKAHQKYLTRAKLSPDGLLLATTSADTTVKLFDVKDHKFVHKETLVGHGRWVWDCAFANDSSYLLTASSDNTARLWDLKTSECIRQYKGHHKAVVTIALNDIEK